MLLFPNIPSDFRRPVACFILAVALFAPSPDVAQAAEPEAGRAATSLAPDERREQVGQLIERLASTSRSERVTAQKALLELGPSILHWLPAPESVDDPQVRETLGRLRTELQQRQAAESLQPRTVTLQGRFPLSQVLEQIAQKSDNPIEVEQLSASRLERDVVVNFDATPFWQAILMLTDEQKLLAEPSPDGQAIALKESGPGDSPRPLSTHSGACLIQVWPAERRSAPGNAERDLLEVRIDLLLEPRLHAVFLRYAVDDFELKPPGGAPLTAFTPKARYERPLVGGIGATLQERFVSKSPLDDQKLHLRGRITFRTAAVQETFRFPAGNVPRPVTSERGGVAARLHSSRWGMLSDGATVLKARLSLLYDDPGPEFESHRAGQLYRNAWIETADMRRIPADVSVLRQLDRGAELELRFPNLEPDVEPRAILYRAPRQFVNLPVEFDLDGVPLVPRKPTSRDPAEP